jgi:hypothetical protein
MKQKADTSVTKIGFMNKTRTLNWLHQKICRGSRDQFAVVLNKQLGKNVDIDNARKSEVL